MEKAPVKQSEKTEVKADIKPSEKKNVRMRKGSIIINIERSVIEDYKRQGFKEIQQKTEPEPLFSGNFNKTDVLSVGYLFLFYI